MLYRSKLTNADLIEHLKNLIPDKSCKIYCDSAEPGKIKELKTAGFYALESRKNVKEGIDFVKRQEIYTRDENVNLNKELEEYVWKKNSKGELLDEPVHYNNHLMDALRYAIYSRKESGIPNIRIIYW
ncbi:MAG: terminase large subunit [Ignavibacteria bacterium]|nr:terminase large subunit [Ignavibacteria bacterium]